MEALRGREALKKPKFEVAGRKEFPLPGEGLCELVMTFRDIEAAAAGFRLTNGKGEELVVRYDRNSGEFVLDFSRSGQVDYSQDPMARSIVTIARDGAPQKAGFERETYAPAAADGSLSLRLLLDRSSVECFERNGHFVITDYIFPSVPYDRIEFFAENGRCRITDFAAYPLIVPETK